MKQCATCGEFKSLDQYSWRNQKKGRRWGTCKDCQSGQRKKWYEANKETHKASVRDNKKKAIQLAQQYVWDYLSTHPCVGDGTSPCPNRETDPVVLEFDHVRGRKKMAVSNLVKEGYSISVIQEEIAKCVVRCANCHRKKTHKERGWWRG
jgi:hypothetical protein